MTVRKEEEEEKRKEGRRKDTAYDDGATVASPEFRFIVSPRDLIEAEY